MSMLDFLAALQQVFRQRGHSFRLEQLLNYVEDVWPLIADNPEPDYWSDRFLETQWLRAAG
jgi:hypothetical protein